MQGCVLYSRTASMATSTTNHSYELGLEPNISRAPKIDVTVSVPFSQQRNITASQSIRVFISLRALVCSLGWQSEIINNYGRVFEVVGDPLEITQTILCGKKIHYF